jgi:hypothetical protein
MALSKCIFCGSHAYGKGCPFSPHKYHVHMSNNKKCIYCGSTAIGNGCIFNPFGKIHVHGIDYNQMISSSVDNTITSKYLIEKLSTPFNEMPAYKLGLIDENGHFIKKPETLKEHACLSILDKYIINLKQIVGNKLPLINNSIYLNYQQNDLHMESYAEHYEKEVNLKRKFENIFNDLNKIVDEAYNEGVSTLTIEKVLLETIK